MVDKIEPTEDQRELIKSLERAKQELEDSYEELQITQAQLIQSEKLGFAGRMAASVAHEIRNPLSIMMMAMQSLQKDLGPDFSGKEYIEVVMRSIKRISGLIDEFVDVARPPKLKMRLQDMHKFLDKLIQSTKGKFEAQNIEVIKDFNPELLMLMLDEEHLERAFVNIFFNSIDAMPEGGKFTISTRNEENYVVIEFVDTGMGIAESDIINIFDPFFSSKKKGAGLGLSIALGIIHSHGGTIGVESAEGQGSTFIVRLPIREYKGRTK